MLAFFRANHADILEGIRTTGASPDEVVMKKALQEFKDGFQVAEGS